MTQESTPNFIVDFLNDEIEFESRCHFYRVRFVERNRNPHSLQLTDSMGGHHLLTRDSKSRCLTIFLTLVAGFIFKTSATVHVGTQFNPVFI